MNDHNRWLLTLAAPPHEAGIRLSARRHPRTHQGTGATPEAVAAEPHARHLLHLKPREASARVAREPQDRGFREVYPLRGGFKAWKRAGLDIEPK